MVNFYWETHLVHRVHSFHYSVLQKLEVAEFYRVVSAVVLQIFLPNALLEGPSPGHSVSVHVWQLAFSSGGSVTRWPGYQAFRISQDFSVKSLRRQGRMWKPEHYNLNCYGNNPGNNTQRYCCQKISCIVFLFHRGVFGKINQDEDGKHEDWRLCDTVLELV